MSTHGTCKPAKDLYLIGFDNTPGTGGSWWDDVDGDELVHMLQLNVDKIRNDEIMIKDAIGPPFLRKHLSTGNPEMGNLDAASGVYVSPTGQLILYTAKHDNDGVGSSLPVGEYRNIGVYLAGTEAYETMCPWAELYWDPNGWHDGVNPFASLMLDFKDRMLDNHWCNLDNESVRKGGIYHKWGDDISSMRWYLAPGQEMLLFDAPKWSYSHSVLLLVGDGTIKEASTLGGGWNNNIDSIFMHPFADIGGPYDITAGELGLLYEAGRCYHEASTFKWEVVDESSGCTFGSSASAFNPSIGCTSAGTFEIRPTVTETFPVVGTFEATASTTVTAHPRGTPVAVDDRYTTPSDTTLTVPVEDGVLANDLPKTLGLLSVYQDGLMETPHGSVALSKDGGFVYTPDGGWSGEDTFVYQVEFQGVLSEPGRVTIDVAAPPPPLPPPTPPPPDPIDTVGLVDPTTGEWHLGSASGTPSANGTAATSFYFGNPGDVPFMGDWDGDGIATPGLFRQSDAYAYLRNSNTQGVADIRFFFGNPSDIPLAGDWDGDGVDTLSIYRPSEQCFYIINELGENEGGLGEAEYSFLFGNPGDKPVVGDWDGDGIDEVGLHRESTGFFYWRNTLDTGIADGEIFFGDPGDRFVAGDWGTVDGADTPAVFRPADVTFYFRHTLTQGVADSQFTWTGAGPSWLPVAGRFGLD